ncbi:hypothetical protein ACFL6S_10165 [Candidatus Poribacteria bacterium]
MQDATSSNSTRRFVDSVTEYADSVLKRCHDKYSGKETPFLTDGINLKTGEPSKWEKHVTSNLACQQNFLRTLDGLAALTGESKYQEYARKWISHALSVLQDSESGMLYWGGHTSYDLLENKPLLGNHELKCVYPYYSYIYGVDPKAASFLIEGIWHKHVKDWSTLLFNRHGEYNEWDRESAWEFEYTGGPLPIVENSMLSFINTGSDLIYSGSLLAKLSGDRRPLVWAKRLLNRYDEVRNEKTGLGGYQFNHRDPCRVRISFKKPLSDRQDVNETTVLKSGVMQTRYARAALVWMNLFEELGPDDGQEFIDFTSKDLIAIAEHAYDFSDHTFTPLLVDGMKLSPSDCMEGVGYCSPRSLEKVQANGLSFLVYAKAHRITGSTFFWRMARSLAQGIGWGAIFDATDDQSPELKTDLAESYQIPLPHHDHVPALMGLIELYKTTDQREYLTLAINLGEKLIQEYFVDSFFTTGRSASKGYTNIDSSLPVALLHLVAVVEGKSVDLPTFYPNSTSFDPKVVISRRKRA